MKYHRTRKLPVRPSNYTVNVTIESPYEFNPSSETFNFATIAEVKEFTESLSKEAGWAEFQKWHPIAYGASWHDARLEIFEHADDGVFELSDSQYTPDLGPPRT